MPENIHDNWMEDVHTLREWAHDVFAFTEQTMGMKPSEPIDALRGVEIPFVDAMGRTQKAMLFDKDGTLVFNDLRFYKQAMFKNQSRKEFKEYNGTRFTWQQTVTLTAYNRATNTFGRDTYELSARWISVRSGHGTGKTGTEAVVALHFLICFHGSQIGMTANTEQQVQDIFLKEFSIWKRKLPTAIADCIIQTADHIRIDGTEDWFLRAQVARAEKPEALAGLHAKYVLIIVDEASGVHDKVYEVMKGALTGDYYIVFYASNPTRNEGEFYESQKAGSRYTNLAFSSRHSPIVKEGYIQQMEEDYPSNGNVPSDEVLIRVDGEFAGQAVMDEKGWIPLLSNVRVHLEPDNGQIIGRGIIALDPAGSGKDSSSAGIRDNVYLKEVLNEQTSEPKDLARKLETIRDAYGCSSNDIGIEAFGIGAKVVAEVNVKVGESVNALLTDKPREGTEALYASYKMELAWKFRQWLLNGGIIITNNPKGWMKELEKVKYKRTMGGQMQLMPKPMFKKEYGFSPDRFDMAIHTFFKDSPSTPVVLTRSELERKEAEDFMRSTQSTPQTDAQMSSM